MKQWLTVDRKLLAVILIISLLSIGFMPIIASNNNNSPLETDITIINVYSYPTVGGKWAVMFTTVGKADLTITAVNVTAWSNINNSGDLRFLSIKRGNETLEYEWINNSVFIANYSSNDTGYETSKVLTTGIHTLRFQFGDDIAYAYNDASNWWNGSWKCRKLVTINSSQVDGNLTDFPILINKTDNDLRDDAQDDGDDIAFVLYSDNSTKLNHEIELFNGTSGELVAWVNVTSLSSSVDTKIWMYYDNSGCSSQENPSGVWDGNYIAVWHLNETSGTHYDSTSNNYDSSAVVGVTQDANGKADGGDEFDGSSSYIDITMNLPSTVTITAWARSTAGTLVDMLWCIDSDNQGPDLFFYSGVISLNTWDSASNPFCSIPSDVDEWHLYTTVIQSGNTNLYIDDQLGGTANYRNPTGSDFHISSSAGYDWEGSIDEVRISNIARNSSWINTSYNTMNNTDIFLNFGSEEESVPLVSNPVPSDGATDVDVPPSSFNITISDPNEENMNITWRTNESGSWVTFNITNGSGAGVGDGTYNATNTSWVDTNLTKYWWSANVTDGTDWTNNTYSFTTRPENYVPTINNVYPANGSTGIDLQVTCHVQVNDLDSDTMTVYWYNSSDGVIYTYQQTNSSVSSGDTVYWNYTQATTYKTTYWWKVAVNDTKNNVTAWYNFTTRSSDFIKPSSNVTAISPYWHGADDNPLSIICTDAKDDAGGDGVKNVTLYYWNSTDNSTWSGPWNFGADEDPWVECNWSFTFPNGTCWYRFYSRAADNASPPNIEDTPAVNDTECGYDATAPTSSVDPISPYDITISPLTINATASDSHNDVKNVTLWYRYSSANFSWWNVNWPKRKAIYLNTSSGTTPSNYQVLLNITYESDMNANFSDLRFVNYTNPSIELDYWIESKSDNNWANVWVEIDTPITTTNQTLTWMYYGNSSAESKSNGTAAFEFFDDFPGTSLDASTWSATGSYSVNNGIKITTGSVYTDSTVASSPQNLTFEMKASYSGPDASYSGLEIADAQSTSGSNGGANALAYHMTDSGGQDITLWGADGTVASYNIVSQGSLSPNPTLGTYYILGFSFYGTSDISYFYQNLDYSEIDRATYSGTWSESFYLWLGYFTGSAAGGTNIDDITVSWVRIRKYTSSEPTYYVGDEDWIEWNNGSNPDTSSPWQWNFNFPNGTGYYEFYSIANDTMGNQEDVPDSADAICRYVGTAPVINSYDLRNSSGSKLNNATGSLDVNSEYYFTVNITGSDGWDSVDYVNITAWYDNGSDTTTYNQTLGGNLNMKLQYENTTGTANWRMIWPDDEAQLVLGNCTETIINSYTRVINISFKPLSQIRWADSNDTWLGTQNATDDPYSWNFNITVTDTTNRTDYKRDEYGVYKYTSILPDSDWVDVYALPGFYDDSSVVTITYSSNYDYNMTIYFEENLTHTLWPSYYIAIADNVTILADADPNDDITTDINFTGIGEANAVDIFNVSGVFQPNGTSQTVQVQFRVYVSFGTMTGKYTAHVATKIAQK